MNRVYVVDAVTTPFARRGSGTGVATPGVGVGRSPALAYALERP
ncbi:hypothetical protein [Streptomyces collinus]|nr:hypothetical protein [Streptomyces collinus]UJA11586.1 hypothetical protein HGI10_55640 [Streptomyces collinus]UJA13548.1 hypothetical protein HGI09_08460 [Streptomyces collinus]